MDITTDGFGFMLSLGDLAWVPFTYSLQARFLAFHPTELSYPAVAAILALQATGYYIFRTSNGEKNDFRLGRNPKSQFNTKLGARRRRWVGETRTNLTRPLCFAALTDLTSMQTERGTKLLTSGWWGRSRHPNYLGDWLMACVHTSFCFPSPRPSPPFPLLLLPLSSFSVN